MSTYEYPKVMSDYENGRMDMQMAFGHVMQHIGKLYEGQAVANASRYELQAKVEAQEKRAQALQVAVDRLTALMEKLVTKRKQNSPGASKQT
ncbi:MAG: hypothetical protein U0350_51960 [Caldilineaceae bacterium]